MPIASEHRSVTTKTARKAIQACFSVKRPVFLWGPPGIGKSELVAAITRDMGGHMIDLRLGQMDPTDIRGIPFYNKDTGKMDWAPPMDLPDAELAAQERGWQPGHPLPGAPRRRCSPGLPPHR